MPLESLLAMPQSQIFIALYYIETEVDFKCLPYSRCITFNRTHKDMCWRFCNVNNTQWQYGLTQVMRNCGVH